MPILERLSNELIESVDFRNRFQLLQEKTAKQQLHQDYEPLSSGEISYALLQASLLAMVPKTLQRHLAQKICSMVYQISGENQLVRYAIQAITSRLGNFPTIEFSQAFSDDKITSLLKNSNSQNLVDSDLSIKINLDKERTKSSYQIGDKTKYFTVDQKIVIEALESKDLISFSAPTSFGKSFVVRLFIFNQYVLGRIKKALIILPTKALIDDFFKELVAAKREYALDYEIITHTRSLGGLPEKVVFVLTQERLSYILANQPDFIAAMDLVYCDEAHSVSRGYRGFVLQSALKQVIRLAPLGTSTKYIFSSPLISNPEYFKEMFFPGMEETRSAQIKIELSAVEKTTYSVQKSELSYRYSLLLETMDDRAFREKLSPITGRIPYGEIVETGRDKSIVQNLRAVLGFGDQEKNLLYTQSPQQAHKYGLYLSRLLPEPTELSPDLADFNRYTKDHFDERFGLAELMRKGIGLHYGPMPIGLRRYIVDQFEKGRLRYLICTSTLLEGVNLPAKNIFIFSTSRDHSHHHSALSFKNLIGRAGRITFGLSGNVICIGKAIEEYKELIESNTENIVSPQNEIVNHEERKSKLFESILGNSFEYLKDQRRRNDFEYILFELFTHINPGDTLRSTNLTEAEITLITEKIKQIAADFTISREVLERNPGIDPRFQDALYRFAMDSHNVDKVGECLQPISSIRGLTAAHLKELLTLTHRFLHWPRSIPQVDFISSRITQWIHERSLSSFIGQRLDGARRDNPTLSEFDVIDAAIDEVKFLEREISFDAPKYLKCLLDILAISRATLLEENLKERIENFLFSVESGTSNPTTRLLYEKGVTRSLAIKITAILGGNIVSADIFQQPENKEKLSESLSKIALNELYEHLS